MLLCGSGIDGCKDIDTCCSHADTAIVTMKQQNQITAMNEHLVMVAVGTQNSGIQFVMSASVWENIVTQFQWLGRCAVEHKDIGSISAAVATFLM